MADIAEQTGQGDAKAWWQEVYVQFSGIKRRAIMLQTDEQHLKTLE